MSRNRFFSNSNPFSNEERYRATADTITATESTMTRQGALNKTFLLTGILLVSAVVAALNPSMGLMWLGMLGGLVCFFIAYFKPTTAPITAPLYAAFEGLFLGTISLLYAAYAGGEEGPDMSIIYTAIMATLGVLVVMLVLYRTGIIQPTQRLRSIVVTAIGTIAFIYLTNMVMHLIGFDGIPYLHSASPIGIILSLVIIGFAALSLIFDFEIYDKGEAMGAPKHMEWIAGLSLLVTLVWIYIEILRLAAVIAANRN